MRSAGPGRMTASQWAGSMTSRGPIITIDQVIDHVLRERDQSKELRRTSDSFFFYPSNHSPPSLTSSFIVSFFFSCFSRSSSIWLFLNLIFLIFISFLSHFLSLPPSFHHFDFLCYASSRFKHFSSNLLSSFSSLVFVFVSLLHFHFLCLCVLFTLTSCLYNCLNISTALPLSILFDFLDELILFCYCYQTEYIL